MRDSIAVIMPGEGTDSHPQESLIVEASWETDPDNVGLSREFSVEEMEAIGSHLVSYTAFGGDGFMTLTGRGPYLAEVLEAAGVDISGVQSIEFEAYDGKKPVSWKLLVESDRFFYPDADVGNYNIRTQVAPMLAVESQSISDEVVQFGVDELSDATRFRLLFGANDAAQVTTKYQIKWIRTVRVVLEGSQPDSSSSTSSPTTSSSKSDKPPKKPDSKHPRPPRRSGEDSSPDAAAGSTDSDSGDGGGNSGRRSIDANIASGDAADGESQGQLQSGGSQPNSEAEQTDEQTDETGQESGAAARAWSILHAVNKNETQMEDLFADNPFAPFAGPSAAGLLAAGALETFVRFRWQKRRPQVAG